MTSRVEAENVTRVVVVTLPGVTWADVRSAHVPELDRLIAHGAVAALSTRTAVGRPDSDRGYMTLGAGNRAYLPPVAAPDIRREAQLSYGANATVEGGTALDALKRRVGPVAGAGVVHLGVSFLQAAQRDALFDTRIGSLGDALRSARVVRGVVSAADVSPEATARTFRRASVTAVMDSNGTVDVGVLDGLVRWAPGDPCGVRTDEAAFAAAVRSVVHRAQVTVIEPGETLRADECGAFVAKDHLKATRRSALERADHLIAVAASSLPPHTVMLVVASSPPSYPGTGDRLTPIVVTGPGFDRGWLTSPTTNRLGQVTLVDVAPTILRIAGVQRPATMAGRPMTFVPGAGPRVTALDSLDFASVFRDRFAAAVFWVMATVISLLAIAALASFAARRRRVLEPLVVVALFGLALPLAAHVMRMFDYWRLGQLGAHACLYASAALLAVLVWRIPGPRWAGGTALLLATAAVFTWDAFRGGVLQVNGVFGYSPIFAGRFYGMSSAGMTIIYITAILGLMCLGELRAWRTAPLWTGGGLVLTLIGVGVPEFGAKFGGVATGVIAIAVTMLLARGRRITMRSAAIIMVAAVVLTVGVTLLDLHRSPDVRTHLGRFAETLTTAGMGGLATIIRRKAATQFGSFAATRWTYFIPPAIVGLIALLHKPRGILKDVLEARPMLRAGLWGASVVAIVGFAINDSGVSMTSLALGDMICVLVLFTVETASPRPSRLAARGRQQPRNLSGPRVA